MTQGDDQGLSASGDISTLQACDWVVQLCGKPGAEDSGRRGTVSLFEYLQTSIQTSLKQGAGVAGPEGGLSPAYLARFFLVCVDAECQTATRSASVCCILIWASLRLCVVLTINLPRASMYKFLESIPPRKIAVL